MARILIIDDDDAVRSMLRQALTRFGHVVIEARDGEEGLLLFPGANADLLITDILMPEKEGLEVLLELRKVQPPVKIIAISGGGRIHAKDYLGLAKRLGASKVLTKPFGIEALMAAVNELLAQDGAADRT
jgi:DNA-binding response OmpR family regulator